MTTSNDHALSGELHRHLTGQCLHEGDCAYCEAEDV
jgi:hypothetical protein